MNVGSVMAGRPDAKGIGGGGGGGAGAKDSKDSKDETLLRTDTDQTRSQPILNKHFDEALEFSQSGSDESIDTTNKHKHHKPQLAAVPQAATSAAASGAPANRSAQQPGGLVSGGNAGQGPQASGAGSGNTTSMTMNTMMREVRAFELEKGDEEMSSYSFLFIILARMRRGAATIHLYLRPSCMRVSSCVAEHEDQAG